MQMFFDGHYPSLPEFWIHPIAERRHIPIYSAVYIVTDNQGIVKYVGQTTNLGQRYADHQRWMKANDRFGWISCSINELLFMESWFIATLQPWMNANQNKRASLALAKTSARLAVKTSLVWKRGRFAQVNEATRCMQSKWNGVIEDVLEKNVCISGKWRPKTRVTVLLP